MNLSSPLVFFFQFNVHDNNMYICLFYYISQVLKVEFFTWFCTQKTKKKECFLVKRIYEQKRVDQFV